MRRKLWAQSHRLVLMRHKLLKPTEQILRAAQGWVGGTGAEDCWGRGYHGGGGGGIRWKHVPAQIGRILSVSFILVLWDILSFLLETLRLVCHFSSLFLKNTYLAALDLSCITWDLVPLTRG